jgi:predicted alpha-1,6-mannanase (GH76 family)
MFYSCKGFFLPIVVGLIIRPPGVDGYTIPIGERTIQSPRIDYLLQAKAAVTTLQQWYNTSSGLWDTTGWWNSANCLTMLADLTAIDSSMIHTTLPVFKNTFVKAQEYNFQTAQVNEPSVGPPNGFINQYYDDEGWWALAWIKVFDLVHDPKYLSAAADIFKDMTTGWGATCGGVWWNKNHTQNGAIENELFLSVAAHLANRMPDKDYYVDWALKEWTWFKRSGMINAQNNINNGLDLTTCENDNGTIWSYNQGVILGGLVELSRALPDDSSYLRTANNIATAALEVLTDSNGILHDPCEPNCGADGSQFKGIFLRNVQVLYGASSSEQLKTFVERNADSIWTNDRGVDNELGIVWSGPFTGGANASTQSSACDALVAAVGVW